MKNMTLKEIAVACGGIYYGDDESYYKEVSSVVIDSRKVVSESIVRLQKRLPKIQIRVSMPEDFLMIPMDATLIEQVLINLMENAYVHSSSSDPIDLLITDQPDCVTFAVRDYGIGLDPDQIPFIFDSGTSCEITASCVCCTV